jgi:hypothetical protein
MPQPRAAYPAVAIDPQRSLAAKFAVMHNKAQTVMMCSVEPGQANETALQGGLRTS